MKFYSVSDPEFREYGQVVTGYDLEELLKVLKEQTPCPENGTVYVPEFEALQNLAVTKDLGERLYGGMPIQMGFCNGHNTVLNCLEYHRDSEVNVGTEDFVLLLGKQGQIEEDGLFDTANVKAFCVPAGVMVEVFATSLHYAPCSAKKGQGFQVLVILPKGTNTAKPEFTPVSHEDTLMTARNKWLLAHPQPPEHTQKGAVVGLKGENTDISAFI